MRIVKKNGIRKNRNSNYLTIFKGNALFTSLSEESLYRETTCGGASLCS